MIPSRSRSLSEQSAEIARLTEDFLASGGVIEEVEYNPAERKLTKMTSIWDMEDSVLINE